MTDTDERAEMKQLGRTYQLWLYGRDWFNGSAPEDKVPWTRSLEAMLAAMRTSCPAVLWDATCGHWLQTPWDYDEGPDEWRDLHQAIDKYRKSKGVTSGPCTCCKQ